MTLLNAEISVGELIDKVTILEIKCSLFTDPQKLKNVRREHDVLLRRFREDVSPVPGLDEVVAELREINRSLWDIEDAIREKERRAEFDDDFIRLARSVYRENDRRADAKRRINRLTGSALVEEKSYAAY